MSYSSMLLKLLFTSFASLELIEDTLLPRQFVTGSSIEID